MCMMNGKEWKRIDEFEVRESWKCPVCGFLHAEVGTPDQKNPHPICECGVSFVYIGLEVLSGKES